MPRLFRFVLDASVFAKWFSSGERNEGAALALREDFLSRRVDLIAPEQIVFETCNTIWRNRNVADEDAGLMARKVIELRPEPFELNTEAAEQAMTLARQEGISFYDAAYITAAKILGCTLITEDEKQLEAARKHVPSKHLKETYPAS